MKKKINKKKIEELQIWDPSLVQVDATHVILMQLHIYFQMLTG